MGALGPFDVGLSGNILQSSKNNLYELHSFPEIEKKDRQQTVLSFFFKQAIIAKAM